MCAVCSCDVCVYVCVCVNMCSVVPAIVMINTVCMISIPNTGRSLVID